MVRIGLWGTFDVPNYGDALFPRITRAELRRRLPEARIRHFAPLGREHPTRFDGGDPAETLGRYAPDRLGPELEEECPVVWHAVGLPFDIPPDEGRRYREALAGRPYVSVRDEISKERLETVGVGKAVVVPDPAVLLRRLFSPDLLDRRLRYLRAIGAFPVRGPALVVQGSRVMLDWVDGLARAIGDLAGELGAPVVLLETGPTHGDGEFAAAFAPSLPPPVYRVSDVGIEDVAAAIAGSAGFVGNSLHGNITAWVYGRPHVILGMKGESKLRGFARLIGAEAALAGEPQQVGGAFRAAAEGGPDQELVAEVQARVDRHFDRLAEVAATAARRRPPAEPPRSSADVDRHTAALRRAFEARGRRLAIQRWRMGDRVAEVERTEAEATALREERDALRRQLAAHKAELDWIKNSRTFRFTAPFRRAWGKS